MKKHLFNWLTILMVAIVSIGFVSCSSDDEGETVSIVGIWEYSEDNLFSRIIFNENGTGHDLTLWKGHVDYEGDFTYKYDNKKLIITTKYDDGDEITVKIKGLTETTLIIELNDRDKEGNKVFRSYTRK